MERLCYEERLKCPWGERRNRQNIMEVFKMSQKPPE